MANKIIIKKSSVAAKIPLATDLEVGEIAGNLEDQKLYSKKPDGTVVVMGQGIGADGDVKGPSSATDGAVALYDGTTGKLIKNGQVPGSIYTQNANNVNITGGSISGITDLAITDGGTGASTAAGARTNLGLGTAATTDSTDYATAAQGDLADTALQPADVGTIASQNANNVSITGGSISGITDLAVADGGTGASTAASARSNLGAGDVEGPASSLNNRIPLFDGTTGKVIKNSTATIDAQGRITADSLVAIGTGANKLPGGTTAERPAGALVGDIRFNETLDAGEIYTQEHGWRSIVSPGTGYRNRIINGDMRINQRGAGEVNHNAGTTFPLDRFFGQSTQNDKISGEQVDVTDLPGFSYGLQLKSLSSTSLAAGDFFIISQSIEGYNISDLNWGTANASDITISFYAKSSLTGTFGAALEGGGDNPVAYPFTYEILSANTQEYKTVTIPGPTIGTWDKGNDLGVFLRFGLGVGSTFSGPAGAWASTRYFSATGAVNLAGTSGATLVITGIQFEKGKVATPFEFRSINQEIALCERYFQQTRLFSGAIRNATSNLIGGSTQTIPYMRTPPSVTISNNGENPGVLQEARNTSLYFLGTTGVANSQVNFTYTCFSEITA